MWPYLQFRRKGNGLHKGSETVEWFVSSSRYALLSENSQQFIPQEIFLTTVLENKPKIASDGKAIDDIMRNYPKTISTTLLLLTTAIASADQMTYTISGTGSGYVDAQPFTNATFTLTEFADPATITNQTPSGPAVYSNQPSKQTLWVSTAQGGLLFNWHYGHFAPALTERRASCVP